MGNKVKLVNGPVNLGGMLGRIVKLPDGSGRTETWVGPDKGWVVGGADGAEIMRAATALPERLIQYKVPEGDWPPDMLKRWREKQQSKRK